MIKVMAERMVEPDGVEHGLYIVHWKSEKKPSTSYAAIGSDSVGHKWIAITNRSGLYFLSSLAHDIEKLEKIK